MPQLVRSAPASGGIAHRLGVLAPGRALFAAAEPRIAGLTEPVPAPRSRTPAFPWGDGTVVNNIELRMPPPTLPFFQNNVSFVIFHDAGNVFTNAHDLAHNLLRWSQKDPELCLQQATAAQCDYNYISHAIGIGVRYKTPVGPVRFDFGYNLNPPAFPGQTVKDDQTVFEPRHVSHFNVFFSIGQTF